MLRSDPGTGTVVKISVPLRMATQAPDAQAGAAVAGKPA